MTKENQSEVHRESGNWQLDCSPFGMAAKTVTYQDLMAEYRFALSIWAETKALYSSDGVEVFQATLQLEMLENNLREYRIPFIMPMAA